MRSVEYDPQEIIQQRNNRLGQKKSAEPIMYDPMKAKFGNRGGPLVKEKNHAPPGSLLKVWEGQLELAKDTTAQSSVTCQLLSTHDITSF